MAGEIGETAAEVSKPRNEKGPAQSRAFGILERGGDR